MQGEWEEMPISAEEQLDQLQSQLNDMAHKVQYLVNFVGMKGLLPDGVFTFPDGDRWEPEENSK